MVKIAGGKQQELKSGWTFSVPGEVGFPLNSIYDPPGRDIETMKMYLNQLRQECAARILDIVYGKNLVACKWWVCFAKRKFMNLNGISG